MSRRPRLPAAALLAAAIFQPAATADAADADPFAACERQLAASPSSRQAAACFYTAGREDREGAEARLRRHLAARPREPWLHYYLGNVLWATRDPAAAEHYRTAARLLAARGAHADETDARLNLAAYLRLLERADEAAAALGQAVAAARASGDRLLVAKVEIERASQALNTGRDLIVTYRDLRRLERIAFPDGPYALQRDCLRALGRAADLLGRWREAIDYWSRHRDLVQRNGDLYAEASAAYNLASAAFALRSEQGDVEPIVDLYRQALAAAERGGNPRIAAASHRVLGRLVDGEDSRRHLERCVEIAERLGGSSELPICLGTLALATVREDPATARRLIDRSLALGLEAGSPFPLVYSWYDRMLVQWETLPREEALDDSLAVLEVIDSLRSLQTGETGRVDVGSVWSAAYFWLAGQLLDSEPSPREVGIAFGLAERARARTLLETLAGAPEDGGGEAGPSPRHRRTVEAIVGVHRRLLDPDLDDEERRRQLARLEHLESEEEALREAAGVNAPGELAAEDFASLDEVRAHLAPDQALLAFQVGLWKDVFGEFDGGSWLLTVTAGDTRVHRLPGRRELAGAVRILLGLIERRDGAEAAAAAALHDRLLADALAELPAEVDELVLVPDGPLHLLPFAVLRAAPDAPPLVADYRLSRVPSATLWTRWRDRPAPPVPAAGLVLADPAPVRAGDPGRKTVETAAVRAGSLARGDDLGRLPEARREGRTIARRLGRGAVLRVGDEASEAALKRGAADELPAVHFATHALVDGERPGRSAVLLAPGADSEDGLLQPREIVTLGLADRLVVLSACRGAAGAVLQGEGPMSLARAFFQAGSRSVVAALWPLRDDDTRALADRFYRHLAAGEAVDRALAEAQREMIAEGYPAAAWAGLVALGDGAWQPFEPTARWATGVLGKTGWILAAAAVLLALAWAGRRLYRR